MSIFAANLTMLFTEYAFLDRFKKANEAGFSHVEYLFPYAFEKEVLAEQLQQFGLTQALFNMPPGDWDAGERGYAAIPGREAEFKESVETALSYAIALGCKSVHAMSGILSSEYSYEEHKNTFIQNIRYAADRFAEHGIELMIEPLNSRDVPGYFIAHQREAVELIRLVARDNVKLQFDFYHAQIMDGDLSTLVKEVSPYIGHIQIASVPDRHEPSEGEINYKHIFELLNQVHYEGVIGCEYNPKSDTESGLSWLASHQ